MDTLLTLVGLGDPYGTGLLEGVAVSGQTLAALRKQGPRCVVLLAPLGREARTEALRRRLAAELPDTWITAETLGQSEEDAVGLVSGLISVFDPLVQEGRIVPEHTAAWAIAGAPGALAAWWLLSTGALRGLTLLDARLEAYPPLPDVDPEPMPPCDRDHRLREPVATYGSLAPGDIAGERDAMSPLRVAQRLGLRGEHARFSTAIDTAAAVAGHPVPVLIQGETGTGKSLFARLVHELSDRHEGRFVSVNCAALPEKLVESTLFGHRKGAFTGATDHQDGKFTLADGGTLFLDEIGELPLELQPKLLKVLDDRLVEPVGASKGHRVDTRVLAATNRDLRQDVAEGRFREDLYYRIAFGLLELPPLRERAEDIPLIALHLLGRINASLRSPKGLSPDALTFLQAQPWKGNVRDLENVIGRSVLMSKRDTLEPEDLVMDLGPGGSGGATALPEPHETFSLECFLADARRTLIRRALDLAHGNQAAAARKLGLSPQAVSKFVQREGL